jgi:hypothetical protein
MDVFTMIVIIVAIVAFNKSHRHTMNTGGRLSTESVEYLMRYIDQLEDRLANIETIVIDKEREKRFAGL